MWKVILKRLFDKGFITDVVLDNCVADGLITIEDKQDILPE